MMFVIVTNHSHHCIFYCRLVLKLSIVIDEIYYKLSIMVTLLFFCIKINKSHYTSKLGLNIYVLIKK